MPKVQGRLLKIYTKATPVAVDCLTDASLEMNTETIDVSCKDNTTGWGSYLPGVKTGSLSGTGYLIDNDVNGYTQLMASFQSSEEIDWKFSTEVAGTTFEQGKGYITSLSKQAGVNDAVTFSFTISISSTVTTGLIP